MSETYRLSVLKLQRNKICNQTKIRFPNINFDASCILFCQFHQSETTVKLHPLILFHITLILFGIPMIGWREYGAHQVAPYTDSIHKVLQRNETNRTRKYKLWKNKNIKKNQKNMKKYVQLWNDKSLSYFPRMVHYLRLPSECITFDRCWIGHYRQVVGHKPVLKQSCTGTHSLRLPPTHLPSESLDDRFRFCTQANAEIQNDVPVLRTNMYAQHMPYSAYWKQCIIMKC